MALDRMHTSGVPQEGAYMQEETTGCETNSSVLRYQSGREELLPYFPITSGRVLDVGCGGGYFGAALLRSFENLEIVGVEADPPMAAEASRRLERVVVGTFPGVADRLPGGVFDCVVFNDVLEHMPNPDDALRATHRLLAPSGRVLASIPNVRHIKVLFDLLVRGEFEYVDTGILDRSHLRFFTRRSIARLFEACGYTVESISGINWRLLGRLSPRIRKLLERISSPVVGDFLHQQFVVIASRRPPASRSFATAEADLTPNDTARTDPALAIDEAPQRLHQ